MSNFQNISPKLRTIDKENDNALASSGKKHNFLSSANGKENVFKSVKQAGVKQVALNQPFLLPGKHRERKTSDSVIYQLNYKQKIQVPNQINHLINNWELRQSFNHRRHLSEKGENSPSSQINTELDVFPKPDFNIYHSNDEIHDKDATGLKGRASKAQKQRNKKIIQGNSQQKILHPQVQNLLMFDTNIGNIITPEDALPVPLNLKKVKEHHKKSTLEQYRKDNLDNLTPELIYNLEYIEDFLKFQDELDKSHKLSSTFLKKNVTPGQRRTVVSFLIKVTAFCKYPSSVLFQTVKMFDKMLDLKLIETDQLQLMALTTLWITLKRIHIISNVPSAEEILYFMKYEHPEKEELYKCELNILLTLNFEISYADPFSILAYHFMQITDPFITEKRTDLLYYNGSYVIDVSLLSSTFCNTSTFVLVEAVAEIALLISMANENEIVHPDWEFWRRCLPTISCERGNLEPADIKSTRKKLIKMALASKYPSTDYTAVYKKFKKPRYGQVSEMVIERLSKISQDEYDC